MPKVIQMPRRSKPEDRDALNGRSMILPEVDQESESLAKMQRWLDLADSVLKNQSPSDKKRPA